MTFDAFPEHWAGKPSIDRLVLRLIPEPATVMAELRAGNVDAGQILPDEFEAFQRGAVSRCSGSPVTRRSGSRSTTRTRSSGTCACGRPSTMPSTATRWCGRSSRSMGAS